jgi:hypothetical protein
MDLPMMSSWMVLATIFHGSIAFPILLLMRNRILNRLLKYLTLSPGDALLARYLLPPHVNPLALGQFGMWRQEVGVEFTIFLIMARKTNGKELGVGTGHLHLLHRNNMK